MQHREINEAQAKAVLRILQNECGIRPDGWAGEGLVRAIRTDLGERYVCHEFRFMGALGFGGKFRNNGNNGNVPYVDCYPENETPERKVMIERANARLADLFAQTRKA
jgi:hypothetical protein